jgi:hypothetical protein
MCTKLIELFANRVDERRNMINDYLRGRTCVTPRVMETLMKVINKRLGAVTSLNQKKEFKNKV